MEVFSSITNTLNKIVNHSYYLVGTGGVLAGLTFGQYWTIKRLNRMNQENEQLRTQLQQSSAKADNFATKEMVENLQKELHSLSEKIDNLKIEEKLDTTKPVDTSVPASTPRTPIKPRSQSFHSVNKNLYLPTLDSPAKTPHTTDKDGKG